MFADAIEKVSKYTRPVKFIMRNFGSKDIITGTSTLFFVNDDGVAVTCRHVAEELRKCGTINEKYARYRSELSKLPVTAAAEKKEALAKKYGYDPSVTVQYRAMFLDCRESENGSINFSTINHPRYDIAIVRFTDPGKNLYSGHAVFAKDSSGLRQGDFLCRYGYPFGEFSDYAYNAGTGEINWTGKGRIDTPSFPIEGMFTRNVTDADGRIMEYELSTPGLEGQSGGPLFDRNGIVYGMQTETAFFHLGFDQYETEVMINGQKRKVEDHPFMHVGRCITADIIKEFLKENGVKFYVG